MSKRLTHEFVKSMLEAQIQNKLIRKYEEEGYWVLKIIKANKNGIPDLLRIDKKTGVASWVEVKAPNGIISDMQRLRAAELRAAGCSVRFVTVGDLDVPEGEIKQYNDLGF
jgi:hypothetical protein